MAPELNVVLLVVGRVLFGGVLAYTGLSHFTQTEQMAGYAEYKGLPAPKFSVLASGALLILGGLGVTVGVFPVVAAVALAAFLIVSAVAMHDFWAVPDEDRQDELNSFLKNVTLAGGALVVAASATGTWALSVGISPV
ncbi:DoxX family membrane protein [Haloarcula japonica]|uniref:Terminal quinol oxidase subunit n=1 Tax=Haloarcula japonica (strain ATCC 49778 / DSM 6131 / JCM 7785 / NBRC 101032 / NCIMB 13157 / TR-1) TaxID=1227453 RepID=M0LK62_HALJT|nr:DoxX family membrane protein [Haloarcula japonica]EMA32829.1 terminal quinol oxidase subunit [Haloarcula japonica DSM 6131]